MPRSSRHKSHKQSKHSSKDYYSESEEDVKIKEKSSRGGDNLVRVLKDSVSGEKRKILSQVQDGKDGQHLSGHGNGEVSGEYVSSKRRKGKDDVNIGGDRWNGAGEGRRDIDKNGEERLDIDRNGEKEIIKGEHLQIESKTKEPSNKSESLLIEPKNKSKRYDSGGATEKEENLASMVVDQGETKSNGDSKRKSDRDSSGRKEGKESKDKDRRSEKEKNGSRESKRGGDEARSLDTDVGKKQASVKLSEERKGKLARETSDRTMQDALPKPELKESEKRLHKRSEGSGERDRHCDNSKEGDEMRLSSRGDHATDVKYKDKQKDEIHADKYHEDGHKDDMQRSDKYLEEADKKTQDDGEKDSRRNANRDIKSKDEKRREGERDSRRKDDKYREGTERDSRHKSEKYHEDGDRDRRRKDGSRYHEDGDKDKRGDEMYHGDSDRDDRRRDSSYREDGDRVNKYKEEKYREGSERDSHHKDRKLGDDFDREMRSRDSKYRDEYTLKDRSVEKSDHKRSRDDTYDADYHSKRPSAFDDNPAYNDRSRYREDKSRKRTNEKEDFGDLGSRSNKDQRSDVDKKSANSSGVDPLTDRGRSTSKNADLEFTPSNTRRRSSPTLSSYHARERYRVPKHVESRYGDYNNEDRARHSNSSTRDNVGVIGGSEKTGHRDAHLGEFSAERRLKSDMRPFDKSPSSTDKRQFSRSDVRRDTDVEEAMQRNGGVGKEGRGNWELSMDGRPGDDFSQADVGTISLSSPFTRSSPFTSSSKSLLPPAPFRTGVDTPSLMGPGEDDIRGKSNSRHRRISDPNTGRIQGNAWRGVPTWPSPATNGFLPFPHGPPPIGYHPVMQPFHGPMYGVRPSMELNHPSPYHGRPMGWHNQVDEPYPPFNAWSANNVVSGDESQIYGRLDWDHSRNLLDGRGWDASGDLRKGPNRTGSLDIASSEKENNIAQITDEALAGHSTQPVKMEETRGDQQSENVDISQPTKIIEHNDTETSLFNLDENSDIAKVSGDDELDHPEIYLSKLDISVDLAEPELYDQCKGLMQPSEQSDVDDSKILYMEEVVKSEATSSLKLLGYELLASADDSIFQKAMSLYKSRETFRAEDGDKLKASTKLNTNSDQEDLNTEDLVKSEKLCPMDAIHYVEDSLPISDIGVDPTNKLKGEVYSEISQRKTDLPVTTEKPEDPVSALDRVSLEGNPIVDQGLHEHDVNNKPSSAETDALLAEAVDSNQKLEVLNPKEALGLVNPKEELKLVNSEEKLKLLDTSKCGSLSSEVEAMMPELVMSGSVNLSRIHHSPESTH